MKKKTMDQFVHDLLPDEELNQLLDEHIHFVKTFFESSSKGFIPMLIVINEAKERMVINIGDLPPDADERHALFRKIGHALAEKRTDHHVPVCVFMLTEAWMRGISEPGEEIKLPIRDNPTKTEAMIVTGMTVDNRTNMAVIPMLRSSSGTVMLKDASCTRYEPGKDAIESFILQEFYKGYFDGLQL